MSLRQKSLTKLGYFTGLVLLSSCNIAPLNVSNVENTTLVDGVYIRQVRLDKRLDDTWEQSQQLICHTELQQSRLHGISCQNSLGFIVFSGGQKQGRFIFENNNPLFSKQKSRFITDLLRLDLFEKHQFSSRYRIEKTNQQQTILYDSKGNTIAEVRQ